MCGGRETREMVAEIIWQFCTAGNLFHESRILVLGWKVAINHQIGGTQKRRICRQFLNGDSPVTQDTDLAIDEGYVAEARSGISVTIVEGYITGLGPEFADIDGFFAFRSCNDGKFVWFTTDGNGRYF